MSENNSKNDNRLITERREKLTSLRSDGFNYPPTIKTSTCAKDIIDEYDSLSKEDLEGNQRRIHHCRSYDGKEGNG